MRIDLTNGAIYHGDSLEVLKSFPDNSIDSVVTDPPYGLGKEPDIVEVMRSWCEKGYHEISGKGFMGKEWDAFVPQPVLWKEVFRVLKPGGHALVACGTRTQDWMTASLRFAGFEIRDVISYVFGSGFPKSLNVGKMIDQIQGNERKIIDLNPNYRPESGLKGFKGKSNFRQSEGMKFISRGTSPYEGWGTALKPACEFFTLARKPISEKNIAENVLKWGTGGINIDESRVESEPWQRSENGGDSGMWKGKKRIYQECNTLGRFPANFIHDGSEEVTALFPESKSVQSVRDSGTGERKSKIVYGNINKLETLRGHNDEGSAARFFYCAKASPSERNEGLEGMEEKRVQHDFGQKGIADKRSEREFAKMQNFHPTVKPLALMQYLIRLITPPDGIVLDCFAGSGTTGVAAVKERKKYILIEREEEYIKIIEARVKHAENKIEPTLFDEAI